MSRRTAADQPVREAVGRRTIIFVWSYLEWGGAQVYFLAIIKQAKPDWDVVVVLPRNSSPEMIRFLEQLSVRYEFLELSIDNSPAVTVLGKLQRQWRRIRSEAEVRSHLRKFDLQSNILHIETGPWQSLLQLSLLSRRGANIFVTMHNFMPRASRLRESLWKARMQLVSRLAGMHIIASNNDTKNRMRGWVTDAFWNDVTVAHTAVDPTQIDAARCHRGDAELLRERHGIPADLTVVLALGQFVDRKGRWVFLEAAAKVLATDPSLFFVWVTPKLPDAADTERVASYGLGASFKMVLSETLGGGREDVLRFLNVADIFALPSYIEGLPIALLEAMAMGVPAVSSRVFAIPEAIEHDRTGLLIDAGNSDQLAVSILRLAADNKLRQRLGQAGREYVIKNFDERDAARKCLAAYSRCFDNEP